jgi:hypothetical protein
LTAACSESTTGDHPELDIRLPQLVHQPHAVEIHVGIQNDRKAEPRARAMLALNDEARILAEPRHKMGGVLPPDGQHRVELLDLLAADRGRQARGAHVVARHDEPVGFEKRDRRGSALD